MSTRILLAAPVRDRGWILPAYLERVDELDIPEGVQLDAYFLVNGDEADSSVDMLKRFAEVVDGRMGVVVERYLAAPPAPPSRETHNRMNIFSYLAGLRNTTVDRTLTNGYDYLFSVDSDILMPAWTLRRLLGAGRDVVAATLINDEFWNLPNSHRAYNMLRRTDYPGPNGRKAYRHVANMPEDGLIEVDVTGACFLIRRQVLEAGCRFGDHPAGEDVPFCEAVQAAGFRLWGDAGLRVDHMMAQHTFVAPALRAQMAQPTPYLIQMLSGDRRRFDVLFGPQATQAVMGRIWARLLIEDLRAARDSIIPAACEVSDFHWDQAAGVIRMSLAEAPAKAPEPAPPPAASARSLHRKGVAAGAGRR
jgi:GT2 family glycosyltransferase